MIFCRLLLTYVLVLWNGIFAFNIKNIERSGIENTAATLVTTEADWIEILWNLYSRGGDPVAIEKETPSKQCGSSLVDFVKSSCKEKDTSGHKGARLKLPDLFIHCCVKANCTKSFVKTHWCQ
ncbi:hypothetical protein QR680_008363 [Steinernema hermaphroditum]|uniref:Insulin-like domain-containing protein n=1 Tax=Steinernema hermaphroditum TaxID=289476 RepID=A0AA39M7X0_9BILA|nr:hypothetical protein QR680_008363 [Steinernema hermaphroditum]